ncbi:UNVERIFIED_CONTAM: hypothetical protein RMT77_003740 [Armadillidium vulgare]|nr:Phosphatidylinositol N-acetylglucosaminyltransferase subunit C [Armadillidium vulgare]
MRRRNQTIKKLENDVEEWERVLWKRQPFPDNFVSKSFFRVHTKCIKINFSQALYGSVLVTQEICSCVALVVIFLSLSAEELNAFLILLLTGIFSLSGYVIMRASTFFSEGNLEILLDELKTALFVVVLSWFSSPIIKTLTASVSTDTIHACTISLLLLHLIFHPFGADVAIVKPTMSHNLGLFAAVCLASRLSNNLDVFALVIVAIGLFSLFPNFRFHCQETYGKATCLLLSTIVIFACIFGLIFHAIFLMPILVLSIVFVNVLSPLLFIYFQSYRKNIYGPWDEAMINEKS